MKKTVTVVVATYNREKTISRSLESILKQTHKEVDVVVVDDGSTDKTEELVRAIVDIRVRYIKLPVNSGASVARNRGIQEASGDFILVWDSDDVLYPDALEKALSIFEKHPEYVVVSAPARVTVDGEERKFPEFSEGEVLLEDILLKRLSSNEKIRVARTPVMKQVSYKSRNIDFLVNVELIERGKWFHVQEYFGEVYTDSREGSLTALRKKRSAQRSVERAPYLADFLKRHGATLKKISPHRYADYCFGAGIGFLLAGDVRNAHWFSAEAAKNSSHSPFYWVLYVLSRVPGGPFFAGLLY